MKTLISISFVIFLISTSCSENNEIFINSDLAATIGTDSISTHEIDNLAKQELFDELNRIYLIRKTTLNILVREKLITKEAAKLKLSGDTFLNKYYCRHINNIALEKFINNHQLENGIPQLTRTLRNLSLNSPEGKKKLISDYKKYLKTALTDSLMVANKVQVYLKPPDPISINPFDNLIIHYRGNLNSKVTLIEISDMECDKCRETAPIVEYIFKKYKDKVKFGFTHFSTDITICAIASECGGKQNKFWEMHDIIFGFKHLPDTSELFTIATKLKLDMKVFKKDFADKSLSNNISKNFDKLKVMGLYGTPTFVINGKIIFNSSSKEEIEKVINENLN